MLKLETPERPPPDPPAIGAPAPKGFFGWVQRKPKTAFWLTLALAFFVGAGLGAAGSSQQDEINRLEADLADARGQIADANDRADDLEDKLGDANDRIGELTASGEVPDLTGGTVSDAEGAVADYDWRIKETSRVSSGEPGTVMSQTPREGTELKSGRSITLVVAKPAPKSWKTVQSFSGSGEKRTDEFTIPDGRVRIKYSFSGDTNAILELKDPDDDLGGELLLNEIGDFADTTRVYGQAGTRYLSIAGGNWSVEVQAFK